MLYRRAATRERALTGDRAPIAGPFSMVRAWLSSDPVTVIAHSDERIDLLATVRWNVQNSLLVPADEDDDLKWDTLSST